MKKIEFNKYISEIKDNPGKIFGFVYIYIFIIGMVFGIHYVNNISTVARQSVAPGIPDTTSQQDLKVVEAKVIPPVDLNLVSKPDQQMMEKGKTSYTSVCASCHGEAGNGKGPAGSGMNPPPRNFLSSQGWKNGIKLSDIYRTLEEGIPGTPMIPYDYMPPDERVAVAHYIRNTFVPNAPPVTSDEIAALDQRYNLSKGTEVSAQIPVNQALEIYLNENKSKTDKIINTMRELSASENEAGKMFRRIVSDRGKAVTSLVQQDEWKKDRDKFIGLVTSGINSNGFNSEAYYLNENEWNTLHNYLVSIF